MAALPTYNDGGSFTVEYVIRGRTVVENDWCDLEAFEEWIPEHHIHERLAKWRDQSDMALPYDQDIHLARRVKMTAYERILR